MGELTDTDWIKEFPGGIIVCDADGIILEINDKSAKVFENQGGKALIGKNLLDIHSGPAKAKIAHMLKTQNGNTYTIEKAGIKKFIYQTPWYKNGEFAGLVELSLEIPFDMPHYVRKG